MSLRGYTTVQYREGGWPREREVSGDTTRKNKRYKARRLPLVGKDTKRSS